MSSTFTQAALTHFASTDKCMYSLCQHAFASSNPPVWPKSKPATKYFPTLVNSIVSQQISTKAAASIFSRLETAITLTPEQVMIAEEAAVRACGVTKQKARYIVALAKTWPKLQTKQFPALTDQEIINRLSGCYGIGRWTAEMFLLFAMGRPDVFSVGDLGLRQQVAKHYNLPPTAHKQIQNIATHWSPYRSVASLVLWHEIDNGPVLL